MKKLFSAAALVIALGAPAGARAQQAPAADAPPPSPLTALRYVQDLQLSGAQVSRLEAVKASLTEAHRVHCAPMHASTPTPAQEEAHHREMKEIGDRHNAQAAAVLTPAQLASFTRLAAQRPAPAAAQHGEHKEPAGHAGHHPGS